MTELLEWALQILTEPVRLGLAALAVFSAAVVLWEERRIRLGLFGRYVHSELESSTGCSGSRFDFEVQNFEDRPLDGPIYLYFQCHSERSTSQYVHTLEVLAGPACADVVVQPSDESRAIVVLRLDGLAALKTVGFRLHATAAAVTFWAAGEGAETGRRIRPRHVRVSRWPAELKVVTGDRTSTRRVARSPSWALFFWCAVAAVSVYLSVRVSDAQLPWESTIDLPVIAVVLVLAGVIFWLIRRDAMPVALGYVRHRRLRLAEEPHAGGPLPRAEHGGVTPTPSPPAAQAQPDQGPSARPAAGSQAQGDQGPLLGLLGSPPPPVPPEGEAGPTVTEPRG